MVIQDAQRPCSEFLKERTLRTATRAPEQRSEPKSVLSTRLRRGYLRMKRKLERSMYNKNRIRGYRKDCPAPVKWMGEARGAQQQVNSNTHKDEE